MAQRVRSSKSMGLSSKSRSMRRAGAVSSNPGTAGGDSSHAETRPPHRTRRMRRTSQRANSAATQALYAEARIDTAGKRTRSSVLKQSVVHLDDVELDTAWAAAIRGDYVTASSRLSRTVKRSDARPRKRRPRGWTPWRNALLPRRK